MDERSVLGKGVLRGPSGSVILHMSNDTEAHLCGSRGWRRLILSSLHHGRKRESNACMEFVGV